jgi:hypothetical protein
VVDLFTGGTVDELSSRLDLPLVDDRSRHPVS